MALIFCGTDDMKEKIFLKKVDMDFVSENEASLLGELSQWRRDKAIRIKHAQSRYQSIMAGMLLEEALAEFLGISKFDVKWGDKFPEKNVGGKTYVTNVYPSENALDKVYYSISHAGDYVAVIVSDERTGIDIECKDDKDFKVTNRMFSEEDKRFVAEDQARFRDVWTIKESFLKCVGIGIVVPLNSFTADYECDDERPVISKGYDLKGKSYIVRTSRFENEKYSMSVCFEKKNDQK